MKYSLPGMFRNLHGPFDFFESSLKEQVMEIIRIISKIIVTSRNNKTQLIKGFYFQIFTFQPHLLVSRLIFVYGFLGTAEEYQNSPEDRVCYRGCFDLPRLNDDK